MISASTINDVVQHIFFDGEYNKIIRNFIFNSSFSKEYFDDIKQEIFLIILDKKELVDVYNRGELLNWFSKVAYNQIRSKKSNLYYKYLKREKDTEPLYMNSDKDYLEYKQIASGNEDSIIDKIDNEDMYKKLFELAGRDISISKNDKRNFEIFKLFFVEKYKIREIHEYYDKKIPMTNIHNYIKAVKNKIKQELDDDLFNEFKKNFN